MEDARALLPVPEPVPDGCVGACFSTSVADEWRASDPGKYCDWVAAVDPNEAVARVAGAWKLWPPRERSVIWSTGVTFEKIMALVRRANVVLRSDGLAPNEALAARDDLEAAAAHAAAWRTDGDVFVHVPEVSSENLRKQARVAWATAHALAIASVADPSVRAGLWRTLGRAMACPDADGAAGAVDSALRAAAVYAECEVLRETAKHHFDSCRAGAARACAARALERARAERAGDARVVGPLRLEKLQQEYDRIHAVAQRVEGGLGRVFDASLLCDLVPLPDV